jgi:hypothetical protein
MGQFPFCFCPFIGAHSIFIISFHLAVVLFFIRACFGFFLLILIAPRLSRPFSQTHSLLEYTFIYLSYKLEVQLSSQPISELPARLDDLKTRIELCPTLAESENQTYESASSKCGAFVEKIFHAYSQRARMHTLTILASDPPRRSGWHSSAASRKAARSCGSEHVCDTRRRPMHLR